MKRLASLVLLAACGPGGAEPAPPPPGPVTLIGCELAWRPTADVTERVVVAPEPVPVLVPVPREPREARLVVDLQTPRVDGGLSAAAVRRLLRKSSSDLSRCYADRLASRPGLSGNLDLDFTVGPDGAVVAPSSIGLDRTLGQCMVRVVSAIAFGKPRGGGAKVRVTVVVHPAADPDAPELVEELPPEPEPPPAESLLGSLTWADDGADAGLAAWASELAAPAVAAVDLAGCALGASGTARARLAVGADGGVLDVEVGGVGSVAVEDCVRAALSGISVAAPPTPAALACDLAVGAPGPARVTLGPGQAVIDAGDPVPPGDGTVVVRAAPHTDAATLAAVIAGLGDRPYLLGVEDAAGGLALITDGVRRGTGRPRATVGPRPHLDLVGGRVIATIAGRDAPISAALGDRAGVRAVLAEVAVCGECERVVELAVAPGVEARWLGELAAWCAEAGLPRIVLATPAAAGAATL